MALALLFPVVGDDTQALDVYVGDRTLTPTLGVSLASTSEWEVNPEAQSGEASLSTELLISASGAAGYKLYLSGKDGQTSLQSLDASSTAEISSIPTATTLSSFPANTWGYNISKDTLASDTVYHSISSENNTVALEETLGEAKVNRYNLSFATKVNATLPAGAYTGGVVVSVVATPWKVHTLSDLTYMQDMTSYVCDYSAENETKQLIDSRDGKSYWVAKLKDGNCWMTQNLALDLSTEVALTPEDSDVRENWVPNANTETEIPAKVTAEYISARSWNLGNIILANPTKSSGCKQDLPSNLQSLGYTQDGNNSVYHGYNLVNECSWYENVDNMTAGYTATSTSSISSDKSSYDAHYLIGNYYSWSAATAGSGIKTDTANIDNSTANTSPEKLIDATDSICPKNWRLPTDGRYYANDISYPFERDKSFESLLAAYGYPAGNASAGWTPSSGNPSTSITGTGKTRPDYTPIYFVRSGRVVTSNGSIRFAGSESAYWSSTATPTTSSEAFSSSIFPVSVYPSRSYGRHSGNTIRCIAR